MSSNPKYVTEPLFKDSRHPLDFGGWFGSVKVLEGEDEFDMNQAVDEAMEEYGYQDDQDYVGKYTHVYVFSQSGSYVERRFKDWDKAREMIRAKMEKHDFQIQCKISNIKAYDKLPEEDYDHSGFFMVRKLNATYTSANDDSQMSSDQSTV